MTSCLWLRGQTWFFQLRLPSDLKPTLGWTPYAGISLSSILEIGDRPLCDIAPPELLTAFRRVEARGRYYPVGRLRSIASRVFQFGVGASHCSSDPTRDLKHALTKPPKGNPRPALTDPDDVGDLMRGLRRQERRTGALRAQADRLDHGAARRVAAGRVDRV